MTENLVLIHHGVKGQKWGVRHDDAISYANRERKRLKREQADKIRTKVENYEKKYLRSKIAPLHRFMNDLNKKEVNKIIERDRKYINKIIRGMSEDHSKLDAHFKDTNKNYLDLKSLKREEYERLSGAKDISFKDDKGKTACRFRVDEDNTIWNVRVADEYRGRGLGSQIIQSAIKDYGGTNLKVYLDNEVAIRMYEQQGFKFDKNEFKWDHYGDAAEGTMRLEK